MSEFEDSVRKIVEQLKQGDHSLIDELIRNKLLLEEELAVIRVEYELTMKLNRSSQIDESPASNANLPPVSSNDEILQVLERNFDQRSQITELRAKLQILKNQVHTLTSDRGGVAGMQQANINTVDSSNSINIVELQRAQDDRIQVLKETIARRDGAIHALTRKVEQMNGKAAKNVNAQEEIISQQEASISQLRLDLLSAKEKEAYLREVAEKLQRETTEGRNLVNELKTSIGRVKSGEKESDMIVDARNKYKQLEKENTNLIAQINDFNSKQVMLLTQNTNRVRKEEKLKLNYATEQFNKQMQEMKAANEQLLEEIREEHERVLKEFEARLIQQEKDAEILHEKMTETLKECQEKIETQKQDITREMEKQMEELKTEVAYERNERAKEGYTIMDENKKFREQLKIQSMKDARSEVIEELNFLRQEILEWQYKYSQISDKMQEQHKSQLATLLAQYESQIREIRATHQAAQMILIEQVQTLDSEKHELIGKVAALQLSQASALPSHNPLGISMTNENIQLIINQKAKQQQTSQSFLHYDGEDVEILKEVNVMLHEKISVLKNQVEEDQKKHRSEVQELCRDVMEVKSKVQEWYQEQLDVIVQEQADFVTNMNSETDSLKASHAEIVRGLKLEIAHLCRLVEDRPSKKDDLMRINALEKEVAGRLQQIARLQRELNNTLKNSGVFGQLQSSGGGNGGGFGGAGGMSSAEKSSPNKYTIHSIASTLASTMNHFSPKISNSSMPTTQQQQYHNTTQSSDLSKFERPDSAPYTEGLSPDKRQQQSGQSLNPYSGGVVVRKSKRVLSKQQQQRCRTLADESNNSKDNSIQASPERERLSTDKLTTNNSKYMKSGTFHTTTPDFHSEFNDSTSILKNAFLKRAIKQKHHVNKQPQHSESPQKQSNDFTPIKGILAERMTSIHPYSKHLLRLKESPDKIVNNRLRAQSSMGFSVAR